MAFFQRLAKDYDIRVFDMATRSFVAEADPTLGEIDRLPNGEDSSWLIVPRGEAASSQAIAQVIFTEGRLASIRKFWTGIGEPDSEKAFASTMYRALEQFEQEAKEPCRVMSANQQDPRGEIKTVRIICGGEKHFDIDVLQSADGHESAGLTEILGDYRGSQPTLTSVQATARPKPEPTLEEMITAVDSASAPESKPAVSAISSVVTIRAGERVPDNDLGKIAAHNRSLCDQIVTVAGLTSRGLALYVPPEGQKFMAKNSQNYPRMCLLEDASSLDLAFHDTCSFTLTLRTPSLDFKQSLGPLETLFLFPDLEP